jgi:hypothetical protein
MKMSYNLVSPEDFTKEQKEFVESSIDFVKTGGALSTFIPDLGIYIKDIHSKYIISTDYWANFIGLSCGADIAGLVDNDLPCEISKFAQDFINEDRELLSHKDGRRKKTTLTIGKYATGIESFISYKYPLKHEPSQSMLGITCTAYKIDVSDFLTVLPNYLFEFGGGSIQNIDKPLKIGDIHLTEYEHVVGFLMILNWSYKQIANFMNKYRPLVRPRTIDTIYKCRNRICYKFKCVSSQLRNILIEIGIHRKIPSSLFTQLIGNRSLL